MASWKGAIKTLVPMGLSFIPGYGIPLAAASRALMEGVDRPGKNVLRDGVDWRSILTGGLKGASIGASTQGARALLTGGGPLAGKMPKFGGGIGGEAKGAAKITADGIPYMPDFSGTNIGAKMSWTQALKQPQVLAGIAQGGLGMLPDAKTAAMEEQTKLEREKFAEQQRQLRMEEMRRQAIMRLLSPYAKRYAPELDLSGLGG